MPNVGKANTSTAVLPIFDDVYVHEEDVTAEITALMDQLKIDPNNLSEDALNQPLLFARIAVLAEEAASESYFLKKKLEHKKANLDGEIRTQTSLDGGKKPTESQIENMVLVDPDIEEAMSDYLAADRSARIIGALKQSLIHRREMIVELLRDQRHEQRSYGDS